MNNNAKKPVQYACAECGGAVSLTATGEIAPRPCGHEDAGVIAKVSATAYGAGRMQQKEHAQ